MTKTNDEIIEKARRKAIIRLQKDCKPIKNRNDFEYYATNSIVFAIDIAIKEALSLKQNQQDELLNKFNEKVDGEKEYEGILSYHGNVDFNRGLEKSKQLAKEVFTKTKEG